MGRAVSSAWSIKRAFGGRRPGWVAALTVAALVGVAVVAQPVPAGAAVPAAPGPRPAVVSSAPDVVAARVAARAQGARVEVEGLRSESSTTFVNPDGTFGLDPIWWTPDGEPQAR